MDQQNNDLEGAYTLLEQCGLEIIDYEKLLIECPGIIHHSTPNQDSDCKAWINPNGIRLSCYHQSCAADVSDANDRLARHFGRNSSSVASLHSLGWQKRHRIAAEKLRQEARNSKLGILRDYQWPYAAIVADSPEPIELASRHHWYYVLNLFAEEDNLWIGRDIYDSGKPRYSMRFRPAFDWMGERLCPGLFICPNAFKPGSYSRSDANVLARKFLVVESDTLNRDQVGAIFQWLEKAKNMRLRAVIDTAGKSLHGWFDYPPPELVKKLKIVLPELGCDKALFGASQPCRLPGALRNGKFQTLIYFA